MFVYTIDHIIALIVIGGFSLIFLCLWLFAGAIKLWMGVKSVCKELFGIGNEK